MSNILRCNNCSGALTILSKDGPNLHTKCSICGLGSDYVGEAVRKAAQQNHVTIVKRRFSQPREEGVTYPQRSWR